MLGSWNEWIVIPVKYRDLPLGSQLAFTVWDAYAPRKAIPIGGTTFPLFGKYKYVPTDSNPLFAKIALSRAPTGYGLVHLNKGNISCSYGLGEKLVDKSTRLHLAKLTPQVIWTAWRRYSPSSSPS